MPFISFSRILLNSMNTYSFTYMVTNEASNELVQQKKISMNLISINHAFYFFMYGLKAYNMYFAF